MSPRFIKEADDELQRQVRGAVDGGGTGRIAGDRAPWQGCGGETDTGPGAAQGGRWAGRLGTCGRAGGRSARSVDASRESSAKGVCRRGALGGDRTPAAARAAAAQARRGGGGQT